MAFQAGAWNEEGANGIPGRSLERGLEKPPSFSREGGWGMSFCFYKRSFKMPRICTDIRG